MSAEESSSNSTAMVPYRQEQRSSTSMVSASELSSSSENPRTGVAEESDKVSKASSQALVQQQKLESQAKAETLSDQLRQRVFKATAHILPNLGKTLVTSLQACIGLGKTLYPILVDSGATHSIMDLKTYESIRSPKLPQLSPIKVKLKGAFEGSPETYTIGLWPQIPVRIGDVVYKANFHICERASIPIILGMDFMTEHRAELYCGDPGELRLRVPNSHGKDVASQATPYCVNNSHYPVVMEKPFLPMDPESRQLVPVQCRVQTRGPETMLFESMVDLGNKVFLPTQLIEVNEGRAKILVENRCRFPIEIDCHLLGRVSSLAVGDITSRHPGVNAVYRPVPYFEGKISNE